MREKSQHYTSCGLLLLLVMLFPLVHGQGELSRQFKEAKYVFNNGSSLGEETTVNIRYNPLKKMHVLSSSDVHISALIGSSDRKTFDGDREHQKGTVTISTLASTTVPLATTSTHPVTPDAYNTLRVSLLNITELATPDSLQWAKPSQHHQKRNTSVEAYQHQHSLSPSFSSFPSDDQQSHHNILFNFSHFIHCDHSLVSFNSILQKFEEENCDNGLQIYTMIDDGDSSNFCRTMFKIISENTVEHDAAIFNYENFSIYVPFKEISAIICLPLFQRLNNCTDAKYHDICSEELVAYMYSRGCPKQLDEDKYFELLLAFNIFEGNAECFDKICDGSPKTIQSSTGNVTYHLLDYMHVREKNKKCIPFYNYYLSILSRDYNQTLFVTQNIHWLSCYALYLVAWVKNPEEQGVIGSWSFLPIDCQVGEAFFMLVVGVVALSGVVGNLLTLQMMLNRDRRQKRAMQLIASLATADLLVSLFVIVPSFFYQISPFPLPPDYLQFSSNHSVDVIFPDTTWDPRSHMIEVYHEGFPLLQSLLYCTCSTVSLLTLFIISFDRFYTFYKQKISFSTKKYVTRVSIPSTWVFGLLSALLSSYDLHGRLSGSWSTFAKVPMGYSDVNSQGYFLYISRLHTLLAVVVGIATEILLSLTAIILIRTIHNKYNTFHLYGNRLWKSRIPLIVRVTLWPVFFLIYVAPFTSHNLVNIIYGDKYFKGPLYGCMSLWLHLAGTAWNPWLYTRAKRVKAHLPGRPQCRVSMVRTRRNLRIAVLGMLYAVLPTAVRHRLQPYVTQPLRSKSDKCGRDEDFLLETN